MKKALVTLAIGKKYESMFKKNCYATWKAYTEKHNHDLVVISNVLDASLRAKNRSPAWQKCLILSQDTIKKYSQVAWVDADIIINPRSPDIFDNTPLEMIGAVDECATPNCKDHKIALDRLHMLWSKERIKYIEDLSATQYHKNFGFKGEFHSVVQSGVLVLSPKYHNELLKDVYYNYEDKGDSYWHYEMRPLSYEIQKNKLFFGLDPKFNMIWSFIKQLHYPFLNERNSLFTKALNKVGFNTKASLIRKCVTTAFLNNYFLHFAGNAHDIVYLDEKINSIFNI